MPDIVAMFFVLGVISGLLKSDLNLPKAAYDTLSLLLMLTIGLKGGMALHGNFSSDLLLEALVVLSLGFVIPLILIPLLKLVVGLTAPNAISLAAHYGSVSAGTFAVALAYTMTHQLETGGQVTLYLVLLELPALLVALSIYQLTREKSETAFSLKALLHETFTNRSVVLLVGGVVIGALYGYDQGSQVTQLLTGSFAVVLALFLLEMGLVAAESLRNLRWHYWRVVVFAALAPMVLSLAGIFAAVLLGLPEGSALILAALTASASYIAAPVAIRNAIPEADIGLAMLASLGITFPFNVLLGIPLYHEFWLLVQ
ncbi:sodium-dependent bicarbonate transport family permease [Marinospirillum perlucidum]|uniref:sodium-dependent bicarbonate transport family permease n=1 Tax=Marinospirillum perlucidum TaxID=1982602 RepID=UPI000DF3DF26|nr:sodium-dependent bicarbonate transport family permease [Marinospirillum perlucidum]